MCRRQTREEIVARRRPGRPRSDRPIVFSQIVSDRFRVRTDKSINPELRTAPCARTGRLTENKFAPVSGRPTNCSRNDTSSYARTARRRDAAVYVSCVRSARSLEAVTGIVRCVFFFVVGSDGMCDSADASETRELFALT